MDRAAADSPFFDRLERGAEAFLTRRARIRHEKKEKLRKKNPVVDWIEAFLWAAGMVLLINQYLVQAYQIPSGSMIDTLLIKDHVFVNKIVFGPELLPGMAKLPSPIKPRRDQVIIFENPSYVSRGPAFDITQRIIYMLTLSLVDIDKDENGEPKAHFLIKRAAGTGGDVFTQRRGDMEIRFPGEDRWVRETEYNQAAGWNHHISRLIEKSDYPALEAAGRGMGYLDLGLEVPDYLLSRASALGRLRYLDYFSQEAQRLRLLRGAFPQDSRYRERYARDAQGWYVPRGYILPLGDNRDNSRDGRYFGPVPLDKVLGKGSLIYWPMSRMGVIR